MQEESRPQTGLEMNLPKARPQESGDRSTWGSIDFWEPGKGVLGSSLCQPCPNFGKRQAVAEVDWGLLWDTPLVVSITHKESKGPADLETLWCLEAPGAERQMAGTCTPEQRGRGEPARHSGLAQSSAVPANLSSGLQSLANTCSSLSRGHMCPGAGHPRVLTYPPGSTRCLLWKACICSTGPF